MVELANLPEIIPSAISLGILAMSVSAALKKLIISKQNGNCGDCGKHAGNQLEIHHKLPRSLGGGNNEGNLIGLCNGSDGCHKKWDFWALVHHKLPDGTPLKIPRNLQD